MATICQACSHPIITTEFITCSGACGGVFHTKCAAITRPMLSSLNNCPNIHWFCHECNNGNRGVATAIDRMNKTIESLSSSLSGDLLQFINNFKMLIDTFVGTIGTLNMAKDPVTTNASDDLHEKENLSHEMNIIRSPSRGKFVFRSKRPGMASLNNMSQRSVVVSNIGKDVYTEHLTNYVAEQLKINKKSISVTLLLPPDKSVKDVNYLQYKVTVPELNYNAVKYPDSWPINVPVRDFVPKTKVNRGVGLHRFFALETSAR